MSTVNNSVAFTNNRLEAIKPPKTGRDSYRDTKVAGLSFIITANGSKSFYFVKRIGGKPTRLRIGAYPEVTIDEARKIAQGFAGEIAKGNNPHANRKKRTASPTLSGLFEYWFTTFAKDHKKTWKDDKRMFDKYCTTLHKKKLDQLTKADIVKWHQQIGKTHGPYQANRAFQLVGSLFRVGEEISYHGINPCSGVRMFTETSRERFLMQDELKKFHDAVMEESPLWRDLIFMLLFTGQRKKNVCQMQWKDLDLDRGLWHVAGEQMKNGLPLTVVLSTQAKEILNERNDAPSKHSDWVFPSERGKGSIADPKKAWERVRKRSGLTDVRMHDLRRTLRSWQALTGTSIQIIGKSLGHKTIKATEIYARLTTDPVRESVEKATHKMAEHWTETKNDPREADSLTKDRPDVS
ncbi:MAG: tyrosine-type recombinase/integrase [Thermoguttaceae bacterium]